MSNKKNYNKISTEKVKAESEAVAEVTEVVEEPVKAPVTRKGVVYNCSKLNIRRAPNANAKILGTLDAGTTVIIHDEVGDFYKIGNPDGNEFCMKNFIKVK
jgi:uncharacterized protein YgiM (DUF1202 family)